MVSLKRRDVVVQALPTEDTSGILKVTLDSAARAAVELAPDLFVLITCYNEIDSSRLLEFRSVKLGNPLASSMLTEADTIASYDALDFAIRDLLTVQTRDDPAHYKVVKVVYNEGKARVNVIAMCTVPSEGMSLLPRLC